MTIIKADTHVKHIGWSHKPAKNQNQPKSLPFPAHGLTENIYQNER